MVTNQLIHRVLRVPYQLHVEEDSNPDGKQIVVFIHGIGRSSKMWKPILPSIDPSARLITVDLLGFGSSPKPAWSKYNARQHAAALSRTLVKLRAWKNIIIVGHSLGALVAVEYAARHQATTKSLVLCSPPFYHPPTKDPSKKTARDEAYRKLYKSLRTNPKAFLRLTEFYNFYSKNKVDLTLNSQALPAYLKSLEASIENQNSLQRIKKLKLPIDIIYGKFDLLLVKKNLVEAREANKNIHLHPVPAAHEITGAFLTKTVEVINKQTKI